MAIKKKAEKKLEMTDFQRHGTDTGSPEVQVILLSNEIVQLQEHLLAHRKDYDAKRSLLKKVALRRKFLRYLKDTKLENYNKVSKELNLKV